jgi:hypothetical protein
LGLFFQITLQGETYTPFREEDSLDECVQRSRNRQERDGYIVASLFRDWIASKEARETEDELWSQEGNVLIFFSRELAEKVQQGLVVKMEARISRYDAEPKPPRWG